MHALAAQSCQKQRRKVLSVLLQTSVCAHSIQSCCFDVQSCIGKKRFWAGFGLNSDLRSSLIFLLWLLTSHGHCTLCPLTPLPFHPLCPLPFAPLCPLPLHLSILTKHFHHLFVQWSLRGPSVRACPGQSCHGLCTCCTEPWTVYLLYTSQWLCTCRTKPLGMQLSCYMYSCAAICTVV